jgi:phosphate-selective porin OprO/OprP
VGQTWFSYDRGATAAGVHTHVTPAVFYYYRRLGAFAEYVRSTQVVARAAAATEVANHAWDVTAAYVLTGETTSTSARGVRPSRPFDPSSGQWGALQILARYSSLTVDHRAFDNGLAGPDASPRARQFTLGLNWYPAYQVKYYVNVERTTYDVRPGALTARPPETVVLVRAQVAF